MTEKQQDAGRPASTGTALSFLPPGAIRPAGWLGRQLRLQADHITGVIDGVWKDLGPDSGWLGGDGEDWERGPYYCDGLVPLAWVLDDGELKKKAGRWIEWTLASQREDGFFGPPGNDDWWPRIVMLKVLAQYADATEDGRIIPFMQKYYRFQLEKLPSRPLDEWSRVRGADGILTVLWLHEKTREAWLLELARIMASQMSPWTEIFRDFPHREPVIEAFRHCFDHDDPTAEKVETIAAAIPHYHESHGVNMAMGIKAPLVLSLLDGEDRSEVFRAGLNELLSIHGTAGGAFTGDEHLAGNSPAGGTETCTVVEYLYSLEEAFRISGDPQLADLAERAAYNALPASMTADLYGHQYFQQDNQVLCTVAPRKWYNGKDDSNIFGLKPNFGCCTANLHQGWPKFVRSLWLSRRDGGLAVLSYAPCSVDALLPEGGRISFAVESGFPFTGDVKIRFRESCSTEVPLQLRIPGGCGVPDVSLNGKGLSVEAGRNRVFVVSRQWKAGDELRLIFPVEVRRQHFSDGTFSLLRGPLVLALPVSERWVMRGGKEPWCDWEVYPEGPWNYVPVASRPEESVVTVKPSGLQPFDGKDAPVTVHLKGRRVFGWGLQDNSAAAPGVPAGGGQVRQDEDLPETIELVPYGCARLRICRFPGNTSGIRNDDNAEK